MSPYPMELRRRIVEAVNQDLGSIAEVAERFQVSYNCVVNYLDLREQTGSLQPRPNAGGHPPAIPPERHPELLAMLRAQPDLTLDQIRQRLAIPCSLAAVCRTLKALGLTRKKKRCTRPSSNGPMSWNNATTGPSGRPR